MRLHRRTRGDRGAVAVEFAILVPVLLLLVFGLINFGVAFGQQLALNNAVREGARKAVVAGSLTASKQCAGIPSNVAADANALAMDKSRLTYRVSQTFSSANSCSTPTGSFVPGYTGGVGSRVPCTTAGPADSLTVEARYPATWLISFPPFSGSLTLKSKAVYRCEFSG
jgi:Flp pilus assembly protein TadG